RFFYLRYKFILLYFKKKYPCHKIGTNFDFSKKYYLTALSLASLQNTDTTMNLLNKLSTELRTLSIEETNNIVGGRRMFGNYGQAQKFFKDLQRNGENPQLMQDGDNYCVDW
ncbi:MAG: hypothetical protein AB8G22_01265, partial [Saprospiraceae bacterium]